MKIKLEPEKLKKILESGMIVKGKPLINPLSIKFIPDGAAISDVYSNIIGVNINLSKGFFPEYDAKDESLSIPYTVLERLGWGFKDELVQVSSTKEKIALKGKSDSFETEIEDIEPKPFPFPLKDTEYGFIPQKMEVESCIKLDAKELSLPPGKEYTFELKGKKLTAKISDGGEFTRKLNGTIIADKEIQVSLDGDYYNSITNNLEGEVFFILNPNMCIFSEKREDYTKLYLLAVLLQDE